MDSYCIYNAIYRMFHNYDYKLLNSFIYNWESDFFAVSKSGYKIEVEVKVSRSDYFRDFEKDKHGLFEARMRKATHLVRRLGIGAWDKDALICSYEEPVISFQYTGEKRGNRYTWAFDYGVKKYVANDYGREYVVKRRREIYAKYSRINIRPITNILCPHQFYYAVPKGLIGLDELPKYAGLIEVDGEASIIKRAPYLHKDKQDHTQILLNKFYNLWLHRVDLKEKMELQNVNQ